jgi:tetratricopeptide (TPR) repeat protein
MRPLRPLCLSITLMLASLAAAQVSRIVIPAGTPEDLALQEISKEQDTAKRNEMFRDFADKYSANPAAVAYAYWQLSQSALAEGDPKSALELGDKALAAMPSAIEIMVSQVGVAQQLKDNDKIIGYAVRGANAYHGVGKPEKKDELSETRVVSEKAAFKEAYEFLEAAAFNAISGEQDPKRRVSYIERYLQAFHESRFDEQVRQYAIYTFQQLNDSARLAQFGEKALAANPNSVPTLVLLASAYAEDQKGGNLAKAISYARKAIELSKADGAGAERSQKLSAGVAHSAMGYALLRQEKTTAAIAELERATDMLQEDLSAHSTVLYRLGFAYAKLNRLSDARKVLNKAVQVEGPFQQASRELLAKISARATRP